MIAKFMVRTALVLASIIACIIAVFFLTVYVLLPVFGPKIAASQAQKILGRSVTLRGMHFNPFDLRLQLDGLAIPDADGSEMIAFTTFWIDIDARGLLRKRYRIESLGCDGLRVTAVLRADKTLNLQALTPQKTAAAPGTAPGAVSVSSATASAPPEPGLPPLRIDHLILTRSAITFRDQAIGRGFSLRIHDLDARISGITTTPDCSITSRITGKIDDRGGLELQALLEPYAKPPHVEASLALSGYDMQSLTPYVGKYTGRAVKEGGTMDIRVSYRIADRKLNAGHQLLVQHFDFGEKFKSNDALPLPFSLAVGLLEDVHGRIDISLPVEGDLADPKFHYFHILGQVAANFFLKIVTSPFTVLTGLLPAGGSDTREISTVDFDAGSSLLSDAQAQKINRLMQALTQRPSLSCEITGTYDPAIDWDAIKAQCFDQELAARKSVSPELTDRTLLGMAYQSRFGTEAFRALENTFVSSATVNEIAFTAAMRQELLSTAEPDSKALESLARSRAQAVEEAALAAGLTAQRIKRSGVTTATAVMGTVATSLSLTVGDEPRSAPPSAGTSTTP